MRKFSGCRFAFITENVKDEHAVLSVTLWQSKEDAEAYEKSGHFQTFLKKVEHTFASLYRWKMALESEEGGHVVTSEDLSVDEYSIVTGKSFS